MAIITLVAKPATILDDAWLSTFTKRLTHAGCRVLMQHWLSANEAVDLKTELPAHQLPSLLAEVVGADPVDWIVQEETNRRKKFLLADMESTIIQQEMLDEMADAIGARERVANITARAMNGELDFVAALRERVALFKGQPESLLAEMAKRVTLMPGAAELVATMRHHGATCWLASGGFRYFTKLVAGKLGFARETGSELAIAHGKLTGEVVPPIQDKTSKLDFLRLAVTELKITVADTIVVGDGANDLPMLTASSDNGGLGIAFRAKPAVQAAASHKITHGDLTALLFAQGYSRSEFAA